MSEATMTGESSWPKIRLDHRSERRAAPRLTERLLVTFTDDHAKWHVGLTDDVAASGMRIRSGHLARPGRALQVEVMVPDLGATRFNLLVEWSRFSPPGTGRSVCIFGARIIEAPPGWYRFCAQATTTKQ